MEEKEEEEVRESIRRQERRKKRHQNTSNMKKAITMSNRFNIGIEASVAICNARAADMGIDLSQSPELVVTESTFRKKRKMVEHLRHLILLNHQIPNPY